jgi:ABC-2 type transport system ATP-binding protein
MTSGNGPATTTGKSGDACLKTAKATIRFGGLVAVNELDMNVRRGEIYGLIGPNGAGKTTLLEAVAGVVPADDGSVLWRGEPLPLPRRREAMFYLPDGLRPWDDQYVGRVIAFFVGVYGKSDHEIRTVVRDLGLAPVLRKRVRALSKGYARRLMLALALITPHSLLLLDEPFDGFDLRQTREIMDLVRPIAEGGRTLFLAIHQLIDAERICDRFVLIADGQIRGVGTLDALRVRTGLAAAHLEDVFLALT